MKKIDKRVRKYQCTGCVSDPGSGCYEQGGETGNIACSKHTPGTLMSGVGTFLLGLPKGFCRLGECTTPVNIFKSYADIEDLNLMFNIHCWKHLTEDGHTLIRGFMPRKNEPYLFIILEDCLSKINCLEITAEDIEGMD